MLVLGCWCLLVATSVLAQAGGRERDSFNSGWLFTKDDPAGVSGSLSYTNIKPWVMATGAEFAKDSPAPVRPDRNLGADVPYAQPGFDDSGWRKLNLPHDWGIEGPFKQEYPGETGKLPWWGVGWYRKHFTVPASDAGRRIILEMDGAMAYANVWLNGQYVGGWPYGYASWQLDLTPYVKAGGENVLAIRLDNPKDSSRWYPGGGIYRNVWLTKTKPVHVAQWGVQIATPQIGEKYATVTLNVNLENNSDTGADVDLVTTFFELNANGVKSKKINPIPAPGGPPDAGRMTVAPGATTNGCQMFQILNPKLWDIARPNRYVAVTTVEQGGKVIDRVETPFGIRKVEFTADNGFLLNGERVPLQGVCNHHDLGSLGAAFNVRAAERQLEIMKEMGVNAIRTSHNPPAPELLDLCDRMGFVVMDEAFDTWKRTKKKNDYHVLFDDWSEKDIRAYVRRDRNHPCIVVWSSGNEMPDQVRPDGPAISLRLKRFIHEEDPTRPVTAACNHDAAGFNGFQNTLDVFGFNYKPQLYAKFRATNANIPVISTESSSCVSSRGEFFFPVTTNKLEGRYDWQVSSYDLYAPRWAMPPDWEFAGQDTNKFVGGEFVWTGFDYLGEPTPYNGDAAEILNYSDPDERARVEKELKELGRIRVPSRSSYFGIVDLAGFKKDRFYLYQARWRPDLPMAHILPHWNWPERVGQVTPVFVYTSGDEAELFLNGKSLGRKKRGPLEYRLRWDDVVYQPGDLKVITYKNSKKWATDVMKTTGPAAKLELEADRKEIQADGKDLSFVTARVADKKGFTVPRSKNRIRFSVEGPGEIVATDNGDATSFESFQSPERNAFNGLALVIVRATGPGKIKITAKSEGLEDDNQNLRGKAK
jgi:beta-galactosidase